MLRQFELRLKRKKELVSELENVSLQVSADFHLYQDDGTEGSDGSREIMKLRLVEQLPNLITIKERGIVSKVIRTHQTSMAPRLAHLLHV
jgi:hypothetical protein